LDVCVLNKLDIVFPQISGLWSIRI